MAIYKGTTKLAGGLSEPLTNPNFIGYAISETAKSITGTNLNDLVGTGFFRGATLTNAPVDGSTDWWYITQIVHSEFYSHQEAYPLSATGVVYDTIWVRSKRAGGWNAWKNVGLYDSGWIAVTFENGWSNYSTGYQQCAYRKIGTRVYLKGLCKGGTVPSNIFTLPVGYRPPRTVLESGLDGANTTKRINVSTAVYADSGINNSFLSLDQISFDTTE